MLKDFTKQCISTGVLDFMPNFERINYSVIKDRTRVTKLW